MNDYVDWMRKDKETEAFVAVNVVSFAAWDLLVYLSHHPDASMDCETFAAALGRHELDVEKALTHLASTGVLVPAGKGSISAYRLMDEPQVRDNLEKFCELTTEKEWRFELVRRVLQNYGRH